MHTSTRLFNGYGLVAIFCTLLLFAGVAPQGYFHIPNTDYRVGILVAHAQQVSIDATTLMPHTSVSFSPTTGSFVEGSTFDVPILLDTEGSSINAIELHVIFDSDKLTVINPSSGKSIIGVWTEPPSYDNTRGIANYVGVIPNGIKTGSGLIGTITFKAKRLVGQA